MRWLLIPLVWLFFGLALVSAVQDSLTMDEQNHIARGLAFVKTGDPRLSMEHPPLINGWSALPLLSVDVDLPLDHPSWQREPIIFFWYHFADELLWQRNAELVPLMTFMARVPIILLTLITAAIIQRFGAMLWHAKAGFVAAALFLFDPNVIAHGRYTTTDMGGTFGLLVMTIGLWLLWTRFEQNRVRYLLTAALCLGAAYGSKLSMLGFVPIFAVVAILPIFPNWTWKSAVTRLTSYLFAGFLSIFVLWAFFGFEFGNFIFVGGDWGIYNHLRAPMPTFWAGIERILVATGGGRPTYLLGEFYPAGVPLYFPVAFLVKTPLATQMLIVVAIFVLLARRKTRNHAFFVLIPALAYFSITTRTGLNIGYRHLLPMLPLLYVLIGGLTPRRFRADGITTRWGFIMILAVIAAVGTSVRAFPHYLAYFNASIGRNQAYTVLHDSNIDWGQDLIRLSNWMDENDVEQVKLSYFGSAEPARYVNYEPLPGNPRHLDLWTEPPFDIANPESGVYAISVQSLIGVVGQEWSADRFAFFRNREPDARVGSIWVYIIE